MLKRQLIIKLYFVVIQNRSSCTEQISKNRTVIHSIYRNMVIERSGIGIDIQFQGFSKIKSKIILPSEIEGSSLYHLEIIRRNTCQQCIYISILKLTVCSIQLRSERQSSRNWIKINFFYPVQVFSRFGCVAYQLIKRSYHPRFKIKIIIQIPLEILAIIPSRIDISIKIIIINSRKGKVFYIVEFGFFIRVHSLFLHIDHAYTSLLRVGSHYFFQLVSYRAVFQLYIIIQRIIPRVFYTLCIGVVKRNFHSHFLW